MSAAPSGGRTQEVLHDDSFEDEVGYLKWSSAALQSLLEQEETRRAGLERKAMAATAFALGVGAYSVRTIGDSPHWPAAALTAIGGVVAAAAIYFVFHSVRVKRVKVIRASQLVAHDILDLEVWGRYKSAAEHLRDTLEGVREEVEETGRHAERAQVTSLISGLVFLGATLVHVAS